MHDNNRDRRSAPSLLHGVFPILATAFQPDDEIDYESQKRLIDFCIDGGVHGLVILANASEGHLLSEEEKLALIRFTLDYVQGRIPIIVTVNHPSVSTSIKYAQAAEKHGAAAVMSLPPFFGRWRAGLGEIFRYYERLNDAIRIPIVIQDHDLSDIVMPVPFLLELGEKLENVKYLKLESGNIIFKARQIAQMADHPFDGIFGGNSGIFLPEEMDAGCTGTMPACYMPEVFRKTWDLYRSGNREEAVRYFTPFSRLAAYEKDVANRCIWKEILVRRKVIASGSVREPRPGHFDSWQIGQLLEVAKSSGLL